MKDILEKIVERINTATNKMGFLDALFGIHKHEALNGTPVVLFGAGALGEELCSTLKHNGVAPICYCDNNNSKNGNIYNGIPVISFDDLKKLYKDSLIVIAAQKYAESITKQLIANGFRAERIMCKKSDPDTNAVIMYSMIGTQIVLAGFKQNCDSQTLLDVLRQNEQKVFYAYNLFADRKSKELFIAKLALMASNENFQLFKDFILTFSEPLQEFGFGNYDGTTEDYYYFNNDILSVSSNEVYVDVGAYDGDTVETFVEACINKQVEYKHIYAIEPDPQCYSALIRNTKKYKNVSCHQLGLGSQSGELSFLTSDKTIHDQAGTINKAGNITIQVVGLDEFLHGKEVTFIKMDPSGNVIPDVVKGAAGTIAKYKPKLVLGAYHAFNSIFEIPLLVNSICPDYKLYLRHNTFHLCDTDLYATI